VATVVTDLRIQLPERSPILEGAELAVSHVTIHRDKLKAVFPDLVVLQQMLLHLQTQAAAVVAAAQLVGDFMAGQVDQELLSSGLLLQMLCQPIR
jgi:hypothetical protein